MSANNTDLFRVGQYLRGEFDKVQEGQGELDQELKTLIDLRATAVSLGAVEQRVETLETEIDGGTYS